MICASIFGRKIWEHPLKNQEVRLAELKQSPLSGRYTEEQELSYVSNLITLVLSSPYLDSIVNFGKLCVLPQYCMDLS